MSFNSLLLITKHITNTATTEQSIIIEATAHFLLNIHFSYLQGPIKKKVEANENNAPMPYGTANLAMLAKAKNRRT